MPVFVCLWLLCCGVRGYAQEGARADTVRVYQLQGVHILGERSAVEIPGSFTRVVPQRYEEFHAVSIEEILRSVPGVFARLEDGFGLRVNVGIRGLPPTRSEKVLVLEDGIPIAPAPYGYPELYYHPPLERFHSVEVVKGGGQVLYGPQTIGGVINYLTPQPLAGQRWYLRAAGGTRGYGKLYLRYGTVAEGGGAVMVDGLYKRGELNRENTGTRIWDVSTKALLRLGPGERLLLKLDCYDEVTQATYAGLTQVQFEENPFQNPFAHDTFLVERYAGHVRWEREVGRGKLSVTGYGAYLQRDWWRQGSLVRQQTADGRDTLVSADNSADPGNYPGVRALPDPNRADGRLRRYWFAGFEGRGQLPIRSGEIAHLLQFGVRLHGERQHRYQLRAASALGRTGVIVEDNWRWGTALGGFLQEQLLWRDWSATLGLRSEFIVYRRTNALAQNGMGGSGQTHLWAVIPALGVTYSLLPSLVLFAGVHSGFAPPRVEDVIDDTGGITELQPERSWNWEFGLRGTPVPGIRLELTAFRLDFQNQIIPATLAGGVIATLTNAGRTLHQGLEGVLEVDAERLSGLDGLSLLWAVTWLPVARYEGERFSILNPQVRITGHRLPYAPEYLHSLTVQWKPWDGVMLQAVVTSVGAQFADDLNTVAPTPNGRQGRIPPFTVVDGTAEWHIGRSGLRLALAVKNALNRLYIADRSRGILPGAPRTVSLELGWER